MSAERSTHTVILDDYEIVNLKHALVFLADVGGDTGDWYAQVLSKLVAIPKTTLRPNKDAQQLRRDLALRVGWSQVFSR